MRRKIYITALLVLACLATLATVSTGLADEGISDRKFTNVNQVGLMINNNGFLGTNLPSREDPNPSFEYPLGTHLERMIRGGIWVGAVNLDTDTLVSTACIDDYAGAAIVSEFWSGPMIEDRSSLRNSPDYDPNAVSELDFYTYFMDTNAELVDRHVPLNIKVHMKTYCWSFQPVDQFVICSYTIENIGRNRLEHIYFGMAAELLSCDKDYEDDSFPGNCFDTKHLRFDEEMRVVGCHRYDFNQTIFPGWAGYSILGSGPEPLADSTGLLDGKTISFDWWPWDPGEAEGQLDTDRYRFMSSGVIDPEYSEDTGQSGSQDPAELVAVGPYRFLDPGDTLNVVVAFVGGRNWDDYLFRTEWAIKTFESNYQIPEPPPSPKIFVDPGRNNLTLFWDASPETIPDPVLPDSMDWQGYRVYLSRDNVDYTLVGEYDMVDTIGFNTGFAAVRESTTIDGWGYNYKLEIPGLKDGFKYYVAVTSYDRGDKVMEVPSLESGISQNRTVIVPGPDEVAPGQERPDVVVFPNPYRGEAAWDGEYSRERLIYFGNLPRLCTIRIYTIAGDLIDTIEFDSENYHAIETAALYNPVFNAPELSGGLAGWDLLTSENQSVASGLYVFSVDDHETGDIEVGKFLVIR